MTDVPALGALEDFSVPAAVCTASAADLRGERRVDIQDGYTPADCTVFDHLAQVIEVPVVNGEIRDDPSSVLPPETAAGEPFELDAAVEIRCDPNDLPAKVFVEIPELSGLSFIQPLQVSGLFPVLQFLSFPVEFIVDKAGLSLEFCSKAGIRVCDNCNVPGCVQVDSNPPVGQFCLYLCHDVIPPSKFMWLEIFRGTMLSEKEYSGLVWVFGPMYDTLTRSNIYLVVKNQYWRHKLYCHRCFNEFRT